MRCVNKRSKDFKRLAEHYNVSIDQLELYTHKYWVETGNEDSFPTTVYIAAQMGKMPYYEQSDSVREFWERHYSTPREYTTKEGWQKAYNEAKTYFPEHALVTYSNTKGNYVLTVRKPVDTIKPSIDDFIKWNAVEQQDKEDYQLITDNLVSELENNRNFAQAKKLRTRLSNERRANRQLDITLASIDNAVQSGQWSEAAIDNLNNLVKSIKDGEVDFERTVGERFSFTSGISEAHAGASIITRGAYGSSETKPGDAKQQYERDAAQGKQQEKAVESWAKANDLWLNDYTDEEGNKADTLESLLNSQWQYFDQGSEAEVFRYDDNTVLKSINLSHSNDNIAKQLDKIAIFNNLFPETALQVVGFGRDSLGHFRIIALQPLVRGSELSDADLKDFHSKYPMTVQGPWSKTKDGSALVTDLSPSNILKDVDGNYFVIDADVVYNTPEMGGKVKFSNKISASEDALEDSNNNFDVLQMAMENRKTPTTFTFSDGTTVQAPFQVNQQQKDALNAMNDFIHSDETSMTLSGYAGTGKTSLMEMLAKKMDREHRRIVFSATTNKAAAVLKSRVARSGFDAYTLNKVFGIAVEVDSNKKYDAKNLVNVIRESDIISPGDVVVIDEASMINENNYKVLNQIAKENGLKIIYVGDKAQLAPVNETEVSRVFRNDDSRVVELTQVERTDDNAILKEATAIRNGEKLSGESSFNERGEGVAYIPQSHKDKIGDVVRYFVPGLKSDPNYFRILAYTNAAVAKYNEAVRRALGYTDNTPRVGEPIVGYANWGYNYRTKSYKFVNSESYKVTKVSNPENIQFKVGGLAVRMQVLPITLEDSVGNIETFNFVDIKDNANNKHTATLLAQEKSKLWEQARHLRGRARADILSTINDIDKFLFVNDNIVEDGRTLQSKVFDFGYALTVHKSQGSTFTHVLMDDVDIQKARGNDTMGPIDLGMMEDDGFDAANATQIDEGEELDLGITDYSPEPQQTVQAAPNSDRANIRQQLEYVGVSRATDTVTIISNNVKKEDTPLNHLPEQAETPSNPEAIENTPKPVQEMNRRELWEHLESLAEPMGERPISYTPVGKTRQEYIVRDGKVYNKKGEEVHYQGKDMNRILANLAVAEDRGVVVTYRNNDYVVDNHQNITSVKSGDIMKWGPENGDRKAIIQLAEQKFKTLIENRQQRLSETVPELMDLLKAQGITLHDKADIEKFLKENPQWATKVQKLIGKKARAQFEQSLRKARPDMTDVEIQSTLDFLHSLKDNKENAAYIKTAVRWVANKSITLPQDHEKAMQAFELARKKHIDLQKYSTLGDLITSDEMKPKEKEKAEFNPDKAKTFSNKRTVTTEGGRIFTVYDVENTEEGQREVCKALAAHYVMSPWCLSTFTATGEPTKSAKRYWNQYNVLSRKIAYENGKPVAFNSNDTATKDGFAILRFDDNSGQMIPFLQNKLMYLDATFTAEELGGELAVKNLKKVRVIDEKKRVPFVDEILPGMFRLSKDAIDKIEWNEGTHAKEAWWDMEDLYPQDSLSDSIVSDPKAIGRGEQAAIEANLADLQAEREEHERELIDLYEQESENYDAYGRPMRFIENLDEELPFLITPEGEVYGFADLKGDLYFDETKISPNVQIHEYTHLWDRAVAQRNPELWKRGIDLMKQTSLWEEILNHENYGKKWQAKEGMTAKKLESLIASEVHARLVGTQGETLLNRIAKEKGSKGIVAKLKKWILDFWKELKGTFSNWSDEEINKLTLDDFNKMTVRDLVDKVALKEQQNTQQRSVQQVQQTQQLPGPETKINIYFGTGENADLSNFAERPLNFGKVTAYSLPEGAKVGAFKSKYPIYNIGKRTYSTKQNPNSGDSFVFDGLSDLFSGLRFKTVEGAFQAAKLVFTHPNGNGAKGNKYWQPKEYTQRENSMDGVYYNTADIFILTDEGKQLLQKFQEASGAQAKSLGRQIEGLDTQEWDANSSKIMKALIGRSFEVNPQALQRLLATGNATLTHTQDKGKWGKEFPRLLMEVRSELRGEQPVATTNQQTQQEASTQITSKDILSQEEGTRISLPGYEYFNDLYEDTLVDAEWKIPMLQELDNQLSNDNTAEENQRILDRMDAILAATSEQELHPNTTKQEEEIINTTLNDYDRLNAQIDNLNNSDFISSSEVRHAAELIMNAVSDEISRMQKEKGFAEKIFPSLKVNEDFNFQTATRKEIIETVGLPRLLDRAKELFNTEKVDFDDLSIEQQADVIYDNFDGILHFGTDIFAMNEGFGIKRNYRTNTYEVAESMEMNLDDEGNYNDTATTEEEEDLQEHWQIEQRTLDVLASATELVRMAIHECYQIDEKGNKVKSAWGIYERVNPREAVKNILRWTRGAQSLPDMVAMLERKKADNPWLTQLINRLNDKSGNEADLQSQFYGVMKKSRQSYNITQLENGKYIVNFVNNNKSRKAIFNGIVAKLAMKEHPLFKKGIDRGLLGYRDKVGKDEDITLYKALYDLRAIEDRLNHKEQLNSDLIDEAANNIEAAYKILGYVPLDNAVRASITEDNIKHMTKQLGYIVNALEDEAQYEHQHTNATPYEPLTYKARNSIEGALKKFLDPVADILDDSATNVVFEDGKMYQEDVTPSYLTLLFEKFHLDERQFQKFIRREYGSSEWFKMKGSGPQTGWRFGWLKKLAADPEARKLFDQTVELNFNKHRYMKNMTPAEYAVSMIAHYFASDVENTAWFRVPMQSNKPSSEFIRFYAFKDANYKDSIVDEYYNLFLQELSRIQTVNMRNRSKNDPDFIKNWDTNGKKFNFLTYLNGYLKNSKKTGNLLRDTKKDEKLAKLIQMRENLEQMSSEQEAELVTLVQEAIRNYMENKVSDILNTWEKTGIMEAAKNIQGIGKEDAEVRAALENFIWNDNYASVNILQLTVGDIAAYKDADDLQKRLAELHAPGIRANIYATDYKGNRVSDGKYRTVILKDFDDFVSNIVANISEVFDRKIAAARTEQEKRGLRALKDSLVRPRTYNADGSIKDRGGKYWNINIADAQGYSSPSSYRKKALMFGRWSRHSEDVYQKLLSGEYNFTDLEAAFQPLKPFVYSQLHKDVGITGEVESPIQTMNMPFQAKNAEYLLIMADALTRNEKTSRPNLLRAIFRVMEDSERLNPTMGIDTVQFESAIKSGLQGAMNIHQFMNTPGGEEAAYTYMMNQMYQRGEDGLRSRQYNTRTFVHETSYDSYCLQQEVPAHFDNHHQAQGSQERMIIPSDLDIYKDPNGNKEDEANKVYYEWNDPDGTHRKEDAQTFRREYERTISDNIEMSLDELIREFKLNTADTRVRNIALSEILQKEILDNPRYGIELFQACSVDKKTGEFRIPKGDPVQAKRIEQLINSIIKTKVNKQEIAGGPIVQVSNFGTSTQLRIRFNARSGGILKSEEEFTPTAKYKTYDEYKKAEQAGIAYFEVFAPMWMKEKLFNEFADNNGNIDVDAIEAVDPELLKMISYRIPTEDKYSIAPMKVVGFLPKEAGDAIMFPYELTEIDDSDFDVDKRYVMRKELNIVKARRKDLQYVLENKLTESWERGHKDQKIDKKWVKETVREFLDNPQKMKSTDRLMASLWKEYIRQAYYTEAPESKRAQNNNKVLDMTWGVLTNEMTADKILNPGGFDNFKGIGYKIAAYKNSYRSWEELQGMSNDQLKELSTAGKDLTFIDAQLHYYQQNAAGSNLIGVFAVNKVAHATLEGDHIFIAVDELCGDAPFTIAGKTFSGRMEIDPKYDDNGNLIGKTIGSGVSASADTAKEPVLDLMNINMSTAGIFNTLLRLGMPLENAALFMSQNVIKEVLDEFNRQNLSGSTSLNRVIEERLKTIAEEAKLTEESKINTEELTEEELIRGLKSGDTVVDYKVLKAFQKIKSLASVLRNPTFATRFNSITSAVGPLIIDNLVMKNKMDNFTYSEDTGGTNLYLSDGTPVDIHTIFSMHPILDSFSKGMGVAESMFRDMPAGSIGFDTVIQTLPGELKDKVMGDKKILSKLSDFYQSYLLVQAELINPNAEKEGLRWYIEEFPKWFEKNNIQAKYPDNVLVQDIAMTVSKKTGRTFINVDTLGLKEPEKEKYRSAWTDLHKTDPDLSMKLLTYWFFRGGIGFSPKTSTGLIPNFVKENFEVTLDNGEKVSYLDVFRRLPAVNPEIVIDQFIRNNWEESKLVPKKGGKNTHYSYDRLRKGILEIYSKEDIESLEGVTWMRTKHNNQTYLWKLIGENAKGNIEYQLVKPLGDNAEYLEMSTENITNPMSETTLDVEDWESSERTPTSPAEEVGNEVSKGNISEAEKSKDISKMADLIQNYKAHIESPVTAEAAQKQVNTIKESKNQKQYVKFLSNVLKSNGIEMSEDEVLKKFNELC